MEVREAAKSAAKELGYPNLKPEQLDVVEMFVNGCNVIAIWEESLFRCLPIMFDKLLGRVEEDRSIIVVIDWLGHYHS